VTYEVVEIKRISDIQATLVMKVIATGGSGGYRYYHDDVQQANATFNIAGTCGKPFVHTIKVTAGDGQTVLPLSCQWSLPNAYAMNALQTKSGGNDLASAFTASNLLHGQIVVISPVSDCPNCHATI
jgi:hypothetical protein